MTAGPAEARLADPRDGAILRALEHNASLTELGLQHIVAKTIRRRIRARLQVNAASGRAPAGPPRHLAMIQSVYRTILRR